MANPTTELASRIYSQGYLKQNQFIVDMISPVGTIIGLPVFSVTLPGFDVNTIEQRDVTGTIKYIPERKTYIQGLFVNFFMPKQLSGGPYQLVNQWSEYFATDSGPNFFYEQGAHSSKVHVRLGHDRFNPDIEVIFHEAYPRVLYPIDLKPVEEVVPFTFSVNFGYRKFEILLNGQTIDQPGFAGGGGAGGQQQTIAE